MDDFMDALSYLMKGAHMGCDIHWYSETKRNGQWECDQADTFELLEDEDNYPDMANFPGRDRDYWFFGLLQPGVRSRWDWSFPEREVIPDDLSKEVKIFGIVGIQTATAMDTSLAKRSKTSWKSSGNIVPCT